MPASEPLPHFVDDLLGYLHETHPTHATLDGVHTHDDLLEDLSRHGIDQEARALAGYLRRLDEIDRDGLTTTEALEQRMLSSSLRGRMFDLEAVRPWERNPQVYADILASSLAGQALFTHAPAPERARRVLSKLRQAPRLIQAARDNVKEPPGIFVKVGIETLRGALTFIDHDLPRMGLPACTAPDQPGCVASWLSFGEPYDAESMAASMARFKGLDGQGLKGARFLCWNPLTGQQGGEAPASANLGTLVPTSERPPIYDSARYVTGKDAVADETPFAPRAAFQQVWFLANDGTTTWGPGYSLVCVGGDLIGAPERVALPPCAPGQETAVAIAHLAPVEPGRYTSVWQPANAQGQLFGQRVWTIINVVPVPAGAALPRDGQWLPMPGAAPVASHTGAHSGAGAQGASTVRSTRSLQESLRWLVRLGVIYEGALEKLPASGDAEAVALAVDAAVAEARRRLEELLSEP